MKTAFYSLIFIAGMTSCKSVEKMVEKGEYDKAFNYSLSKLQGEKNKKTEYVKALEKAYFKLNSASLREIDRLNPESRPENWSRVLNIYRLLDNRQEQLEPLLPLVSEERYKASFDLVNYTESIRKAEENTCLFYYTNANGLIERTERTGEKVFAREAYDELKKIELYKSNYKDSEKLKDKALSLGLVNIHFDIINNFRDFHSNTIEREVMTLPVARLNDIWHEYSIGGDNKRKADYLVVIELGNVIFSPERERLNNYTESKEILIRKDRVKEKRDTLEVWVEKEVYEKVKADISEIYREKKSEMRGSIMMMDTKTKEYIKTVPVNVFHNFNGYGCKFIGDERALTDASRKKMDAYCELFPSDFEMAEDVALAFKDVIFDEAKKMRYK